MNYRREIDGLRAVAVMPVILFHAGFTVFSGGFVGVDVFFVISGYLITTILIEERETGRYTLLRFYERRARRILPALFTVMAICLVPAWLFIPPFLFEDFARSIAFAALFISNSHFLDHTDYFAINAELQPLLHTWSLAVEEQFYLMFPLLLLPLGVFHRTRFLAVFGLVAALSLALGEWGWRNHREENFFFTFSRLWELLAGSICAVLLYRREIPQREWLAGIGLGMILLSVFAFSNELPFPSLYAAVPVGGTMLIILFAGRETMAARLLSLAPIVGIGLISYSAYLWHQPLFAFAKILSVSAPAQWVMLGLAMASLALGYCSWRYVEQPFRGSPPHALSNRAALFSASFAFIAFFVAFGMSGYNQKGFPSRLAAGTTPFYEKVQASFAEQHSSLGRCNFEGRNLEPNTRVCVAFDPAGVEREIAVFGDSHQSALLPAFENVAVRHNIRVLAGAVPGCPPLLGVAISNEAPVDHRVCYDVVKQQAATVVARGVGKVVLVSRWLLYTTGDYEGKLIALSDIDGERSRNAADSQKVFETALAETISFYRDAGIEVVLVQQVPELSVDPQHMIQRAMLMRQPTEVALTTIQDSFLSRAVHEAKQAYDRQVLRSMAGPGVTVISLDEAFDEDGKFIWLADDTALYFDSNHLTVAGARRAGPILAIELDQVLAN